LVSLANLAFNLALDWHDSPDAGPEIER